MSKKSTAKSTAKTVGKGIFDVLVAVGEAMETADRNNSNNGALERLIQSELDFLGYAEKLVLVSRDGHEAVLEKRSYGPVEGRVLKDGRPAGSYYFSRTLSGPITVSYGKYVELPGIGLIGQVTEIRVEKWGRLVRSHTINH